MNKISKFFFTNFGYAVFGMLMVGFFICLISTSGILQILTALFWAMSIIWFAFEIRKNI